MTIPFKSANIGNNEKIVINGGGINGLVLALALRKHTGLVAEIYEKAASFHPYIGAGMCMYANGLRVLRDISPSLLEDIRRNGYAYDHRRWERHDGFNVATGSENSRLKTAMDNPNIGDDEINELGTVGICRWRLQKVLYKAATRAGIKVHFGKCVSSIDRIHKRHNGAGIKVNFDDGTHVFTNILFGADGSRSKTRECMIGEKCKLEYTGVTCIMGMAKLSSLNEENKCISFPSASTTKCHACLFPTGPEEQCFQFHFPVSEERSYKSSWANLSEQVSKVELNKLLNRLTEDGWHDKYLAPVANASRAIKVGFCKLKPHPKKIVFTTKHETTTHGSSDQRQQSPTSFVVLLGDAAHPPLPYTGQGAQMGIEDCGTIALLIKNMCLLTGTDGHLHFSMTNFGRAMALYETMRVPRTKHVGEESIKMGEMQMKRAHNERYNSMKEEMIRRDIFFHDNLLVYDIGKNFDYAKAVAEELRLEKKEKLRLKEKEKALISSQDSPHSVGELVDRIIVR